MNISQAFKALLAGNDVRLTMTYWERKQTRVFEAAHFGDKKREVAFRHIVKCEKDDFADSATFYGGSKSDCKFAFHLPKHDLVIPGI